jgi:menaquinone-dependent protoporphyrinogen oxidase
VVTVPLLIAYGSKHGSTQEVAEAIARRLRMAGLEVDLRPAAEVGDVTSYKGVVLGGALYFGCWHPDAARFFAEHGHEFAERPPAIFAVGPRTADAHGLAESRAQLDKTLAKVPEVEPRLVAVFGGVVDPTKLRFPLSRMPASDARDWDAIDEWAGEVATAFEPHALTGRKS